MITSVNAYANRGRWVAECFYCPQAVSLEKMQPGFRCPDCDAANEVEWPSVDMVRGVERLLLMRPSPKNQNWLPGETLHDLLAENLEHGVVTPDPGAVLAIVGDRIEADSFPVLNPRMELVR